MQNGERKAVDGQPAGASAALQVIERHYPRLADGIRARWGTDQFEPYVDNLLMDDRGNRSGFPPDVAQALLALSSEHNRRYPRANPQDLWRWADPAYPKQR